MLSRTCKHAESHVFICTAHLLLIIQVNKVAGNFHFAPGRSYQQGGMHVHDIAPFGDALLDFTHSINKLSFGKPYPGMKNPLDGVRVKRPAVGPQGQITGMYQVGGPQGQITRMYQAGGPQGHITHTGAHHRDVQCQSKYHAKMVIASYTPHRGTLATKVNYGPSTMLHAIVPS